MIEQQGRVLRHEAGRASITFAAVSGCPACDAGQGCGAGVFGKLLRRKPAILELESPAGLEPGQAVIVGIPEAFFLRLLFRLYLVPLLAGLAGAGLGHYLAGFWSLHGLLQDLAALTGALILAAATLHFKGTGSVPAADRYELQLLPGCETAMAGRIRQFCRSDSD